MVETTQKERDYIGVSYDEEKPKMLLLQSIYRKEEVENVVFDNGEISGDVKMETYIIEFKDGETKGYKVYG